MTYLVQQALDISKFIVASHGAGGDTDSYAFSVEKIPAFLVCLALIFAVGGNINIKLRGSHLLGRNE